MLLVIDVGNTNTVLGVYDDKQLIHHWRLRTIRDATEDEFQLLIYNLFMAAEINLQHIRGTIISCVVPPLTNSLNRFCDKYLNTRPHWVDPASFSYMPILYENPKEVGADRIVNAVAAFHKYPQSLVVVDFGTATTFDCISQTGDYMGGVISPGIMVSSEALFQKASKLPRVEVFTRPKVVIGKDTVSSMNAGIVFGYAGLVDGVVKRIGEEMESAPLVVATGGLAKVISKVAKSIDVVEPQLTLEGLRIIYEKINSK